MMAALPVFVMLLTGCEEEMQVAAQPQSYLDLLAEYGKGTLYDSAEHQPGGCTVTFADGTEVVVHDLDFRVDNCMESAPKTVLESNGTWKVGTSLTGIKVEDSALPNEKALPVYVYFDKVTLHMYISNGNHLVYDNVPREPEQPEEPEEPEEPEQPEEPAGPTPEEILAKKQNIPVVRITTDDNAPILDRENYVKGTINISDPECLYSENKEFEARMGIRGRGNSTWGWPKKPWKVKLDEKAPVLGMPADKEWALLANYSDRTLIRNIVAMKLSEICGFSWTPRMRSVEVYLNDEYQGVYTLCEHKKVSEDRVNIDLVTEEDNSGEAITGGYYLELEDNQDETTVWRSRLNIPMMFSDPEVPTAKQLAYVKAYIDDFELAIINSTVDDPVNGYGRFIDLKSFIDNYIIQELTKNPDGNTRKSTFVTKERGRKMEMYHIWDFDITLGNRGFGGDTGSGPENWLIKYCSGWYTPMMNDPDFAAKVKARWNELKPEFEKVVDFIDEQALILDKAQKHNFEKWDINVSVDWVEMPSKGSYEAEIEYLRTWYAERVRWMDRELNRN